jgi:3-deoxy-manno-octulosonate cytidylyltransferase (CMP-KDO synthetase)
MKKDSILGVIPARFASTRFPGKPLIDLGGKSMIQRVYEQVSKAHCLESVIVATDDERIAAAVRQFGGNVMMTSENHANGTERVGEVAKHHRGSSHILNIQGDEPLIDPRQIDALGELMIAQDEVEIATLVRPISDENLIQSPHVVKAVRGNDGRALYFSRASIPFARNTPQTPYYQHVGMYGFRRNTLLEIIELAPSSLELTESLEQLRWLENGYSIHTAITELPTYAVDTPEDAALIMSILADS